MPRSKRRRSHSREKSRKIMLGMKGGFWPFTGWSSSKSSPSTTTSSLSPNNSITETANNLLESAQKSAESILPRSTPISNVNSTPAPSGSTTGGRRRRKRSTKRRRRTRRTR